MRFPAWKLVVQPDNADIFLSRTLLRFNEASGAIEADDKAASNFRVKGSAMAGFLNPILLSEFFVS